MDSINAYDVCCYSISTVDIGFGTVPSTGLVSYSSDSFRIYSSDSFRITSWLDDYFSPLEGFVYDMYECAQPNAFQGSYSLFTRVVENISEVSQDSGVDFTATGMMAEVTRVIEASPSLGFSDIWNYGVVGTAQRLAADILGNRNFLEMCLHMVHSPAGPIISGLVQACTVASGMCRLVGPIGLSAGFLIGLISGGLTPTIGPFLSLIRSQR